MNKAQQNKFDSLYQQHVNALHRQGKAATTIDVYSRAGRRLAAYYDRCPDRLNLEQLKTYFTDVVKSHSWSTVKVDRNGLQFFYRHVLNKKWTWVGIVKSPQTRVLPDILSVKEIEKLINGARELRSQTFLLVAYSMGLRLSEALALQVRDMDGAHMKVHVRQSKGRKDRFVTLPQASLLALRKYWVTHRNSRLLFPAGLTPKARLTATTSMARSGLQKGIKLIAKDSGIHKDVTVHSLRHCYGSHLVEAGVNLRIIQQEMGHESPTTTALYTQLTEVTKADAGKQINTLVNRLKVRLDGEV